MLKLWIRPPLLLGSRLFMYSVFLRMIIRTFEFTFQVGDHPPITPMRAAPRDEFSKGNEWRIYDYVTRHFIGTLHDDMVYLEKTMQFQINGYRFSYTWHEVVDRGFTFAMPWKFKALQLNELEWKMPALRDGDSVAVSHLEVRTEHTRLEQTLCLWVLRLKQAFGLCFRHAYCLSYL